MTATEYFEQLETSRKDALLQLRSVIFEVFPNAVESMDYKLPTYSNSGLKICAMASQKHYMALYIINYDLLKNFSEELKAFNCGKSCIRFKKLDADTLKLFKNILQFIRDHISESEFSKK